MQVMTGSQKNLKIYVYHFIKKQCYSYSSSNISGQMFMKYKIRLKSAENILQFNPISHVTSQFIHLFMQSSVKPLQYPFAIILPW